jgi:hypothetical protein
VKALKEDGSFALPGKATAKKEKSFILGLFISTAFSIKTVSSAAVLGFISINTFRARR